MLDACEVCEVCGVLEVSDVCVASAWCWMFVMSGACGKKYSAGGVCML